MRSMQELVRRCEFEFAMLEKSCYKRGYYGAPDRSKLENGNRQWKNTTNNPNKKKIMEKIGHLR